MSYLSRIAGGQITAQSGHYGEKHGLNSKRQVKLAPVGCGVDSCLDCTKPRCKEEPSNLKRNRK